MSTYLRTIGVVLVSSLSVVPAYLIVATLTGGLRNPFVWFQLGVAASVAYLLVLVVGLPLHAVLRSRKVAQPWAYALAGVFLAVALIPIRPPEPGQVSSQILIFGFMGLCVSLTFWKVVASHEPA